MCGYCLVLYMRCVRIRLAVGAVRMRRERCAGVTVRDAESDWMCSGDCVICVWCVYGVCVCVSYSTKSKML